MFNLKQFQEERRNTFFVRFGELSEREGGLYSDLKEFNQETISLLVGKIRVEIGKEETYLSGNENTEKNIRTEGVNAERRRILTLLSPNQDLTPKS